MNIETVNDLIATLESAGELSIREQKFLKLAKAFKQLAEENVALKQSERELDNTCAEEFGQDWVSELTETPATDAYLAGIKADGVESGIKTIMTMLNHQAPGVSDAINVLRVHSSELREGADK